MINKKQDKETPETVVVKSNIRNLPDDQLLYGFSEAIENIEREKQYNGRIDESYYRAAPWVYEVYRRSYGDYEIDTRTLPDKVEPKSSSIDFWANEHVIRRVWKMLLAEGFHKRIREINNAST